MREEEKRCPENGRTDGEMVFEVIGGRSKDRPKLTALVEAGSAETFVGVAVVFGEIGSDLRERCADDSLKICCSTNEVPAKNLSYPRHPLLQGSIMIWKQTPETEEGTW